MHSFQLSDRQGKSHDYRVEPHPGGAGITLALRVQALATEPLVEVIRAVAGAPGVQAISGALKDGTDQDPTDLLAGVAGDLLAALQVIDMGAVGRALGAALDRKDGAELVKAILSRTWRDGRSMGEPMEFDAAYQANYAELLRAVVEVVRFNGFFPLADLLSASASEPAPALTAKSSAGRRSSTRSAG